MKKHPEIGKVFPLTINWQDPRVQPLAMARGKRRGGYGPTTCRRRSERVGRETSWFRLVPIRRYVGWFELKKRKSSRGQWLEVYRIKYPGADSQRNVGMPDDSWEDKDERTYFPYINSKGRLAFCLAIGGFNKSWLWLKEVGESA